MNISNVSNRFYCPSYTDKINLKHQNFRGLLNDYQVKRVLRMLKPAVSETVSCNNADDLINIITRMKNKSANKSIGIIPIMRSERDYCFKDML